MNKIFCTAAQHTETDGQQLNSTFDTTKCSQCKPIKYSSDVNADSILPVWCNLTLHLSNLTLHVTYVHCTCITVFFAFRCH